MAKIIVGPIPEKWDPVWMANFVQQVVQAIDDLSTPIAGAYTVTNVTTDRTFDANSTSTDELADVLGTLIDDLQTKGTLE